MLVYGVLAAVTTVGMLCPLPLDHPRYSWIGEVAHFGVSFVRASALFAGAIHLTAEE